MFTFDFGFTVRHSRRTQNNLNVSTVVEWPKTIFVFLKKLSCISLNVLKDFFVHITSRPRQGVRFSPRRGAAGTWRRPPAAAGVTCRARRAVPPLRANKRNGSEKGKENNKGTRRRFSPRAAALVGRRSHPFGETIVGVDFPLFFSRYKYT